MLYHRKLDLSSLKSSAFLFGPRMTGKTTLLKAHPDFYRIDLLDYELESNYRINPKVFWEKLNSFPPGSKIAVDEIQKVPELLNYVQKAIEDLKHQFILSGSSARKLKRRGVNLLGGRAIDLKLHPLTYSEIGNDFQISLALKYGTLPQIYSLNIKSELDQVKLMLRSYYTTYIKEEIQAEAITRNIGAFQRFVNVAAQFNANIIEYSNIAQGCSVPASTVREYFIILEDTLIGSFLWPFAHSERKKSRPKFYFFDCGVLHGIQNRLSDPPSSEEQGMLFETWFFNELIRIRDYNHKEISISFWRHKDNEIDFLIEDHSAPKLAIECKSGKGTFNYTSIRAFKRNFPKVPVIIASLSDATPRKTEDGIEILPWKDALARYQAL